VPTFDSGANGAPGGGVAVVATASLPAGAGPFSLPIETFGGAPLVSGTPIYVRVSAESDVGFDSNALFAPPQPLASNRAWGFPVPPAAAPAPQVPTAPRGATLEVLSATSLRLELSPPDSDGGRAIAAYEAFLAPSAAAVDAAVAAAAAGAALPAGASRVAIPAARFAAIGDVSTPALAAAARRFADLAGLATGAPTHVRVRAVNAVGASAAAAPSPSFEVPRGPAGAPLAVSAAPRATGVGEGATAIDVTWSPPAATGGAPLLG
jgi:hypothetical protein